MSTTFLLLLLLAIGIAVKIAAEKVVSNGCDNDFSRVDDRGEIINFKLAHAGGCLYLYTLAAPLGRR